jgi:hypothetical protein
MRTFKRKTTDFLKALKRVRKQSGKIRLSSLPYAAVLAVPTILLVSGYTLNAIVMGVNGGQMPVQWPGGCSPIVDDGIHICMTYATHLKVLADWITMHDNYRGIAVASPGDFLMFGYYYTRWPALIAWLALVTNDGVRAFHATKSKVRR